LEASLKCLRSLPGRTVSERVGRHALPCHLLHPVVANSRRGVDSLLDVACLQHITPMLRILAFAFLNALTNAGFSISAEREPSFL
jgi:hypothetical protein